MTHPTQAVPDITFWTCPECLSVLGYPLDYCDGFYGDDDCHAPVPNPMTAEQRYEAARRNVEWLAAENSKLRLHYEEAIEALRKIEEMEGAAYPEDMANCAAELLRRHDESQT